MGSLKNGRRGKRKFQRERIIALSLILLLASPWLVTNQSQATQNSGAQKYPDHALSLLNSNDKLTLQSLEKMSSGSQSVGAFEKVIQDYFLPLNIRRVLLDIGWQNYTLGNSPFEQWVDNWLTASDFTNVQNVFYVGQFTDSGIGSPWVTSLISRDPTVQTYYSNGQPAPYIDLSSPDVAVQMEQDLSTLYGYYGNHSSWVGIGTGTNANNPYYGSNSTMPILGYSNTSLASFANSVYFKTDVNRTGYDSNGVLDELWSSFLSSEPAVLLSSGNWMTSSAVQLSPSLQSDLSMRFYLPDSEKGIQLLWYGDRSGSPGLLDYELFADQNGTFVPRLPLSEGNLSSSSVSTATGWQSPIQISGNFSSGYYWILFSAQSADSADYYDIYTRNYHVDPAGALSARSNLGPWSDIGSSILWVKDNSGVNLTIYPFEQALVTVQPVQTFYASSSYSFNTVFLFLSDRHYSTVNGTVQLTDTSTGRVVSTGILSQSLTSGLQNWIPIALSTTVTTVPGHTYSMQVFDSNGGISWHNVQRGLIVNPGTSGFQNQTGFWLFRLAYANWEPGHLDFTKITDNGVDVVSNGHPDAIRFISPAGTTTLNQISVLMYNSNPSGAFYQQGTNLTVSITRDNVTSSSPGGSQPASGTSLQTISVPGQMVPQNGWLNVTGFTVPLSGITKYWAVFSTSSSKTIFPMARLVSPYNLLTLVSTNNGVTWSYPAEGPTEFSFSATFSNGEQTGNFVANIPRTTIARGNRFAQPFISNGSQTIGVYLGPIVGTNVVSNYLVVSINPDDGGKPSPTPLASGLFYSGNVTLNYGPQFVQFTSVAKLLAGNKYWIVVQPASGTFALLPVVYSQQPRNFPAGLGALISSDGGFIWNPVAGNSTTVLDFLLANSPVPLPEYSTQQLYNDLLNYHNFPVVLSNLRGWNAFIEASQLSNYETISSFGQKLLGRNFGFFANGNPAFAGELGLDNVLLFQSNMTQACAPLLQYLLAEVPYQNSQYHEISDLSTLESCEPSTVGSLAQQLKYMLYNGGSFGSTTVFDVLVLGREPSSNVSTYLSPFLNVSYLQLGTDTNLTLLGISAYRAVLWLPESNASAYSALQSEIETYISAGGSLVVLQSAQSWMASLIGFDPGSIKVTGNSVGSSASSLLTGSVMHTAYYSSLKIGAVSSSASVGLAGGLVVSVNFLGSGKTMFVHTDSSQVQVSDGTILLANIFSNLLGLNGNSPLWYSNSGTQTTSVAYNVIGSSGGPILVWVSNPTNSSVAFSLELEAQYFGFSGNWKTIDLLDLNTFSGSGSEISLSMNVPPDSWEPVYIFQNSVNLVSSYSSVVMTGHASYPNQFLYEFAGTNQSAIVALASSSLVSGVQLGNGQNLTKLSQSKDLLNSTGWFYDGQSGVLLVKYYSNSNSLRVLFSFETQSFPILPLLWSLLGGVIALEAGLLIYSKARNGGFRRRRALRRESRTN